MTAKIDGTNGVLQQYDYQVPTTGFSYTFAAGTTVLVMNPAGTLATGTITMPASPVDGMTISFSSTQQITALTVAGNTGQSIVGNPTTMLAGGAATFVYRLSNTTWYAQTNTAQVGSAGSPAPVLNVFVSPGTWTKPTTVVGIKVTVIGGGGTAATNPATANAHAAGGGGGGTAIRLYPAPSLPGPQPYTVGTAGGTSSFGVAPATVISATGGSAGGTGTGTTSASAGGAGGAGSNGNANTPGSAGQNSFVYQTPPGVYIAYSGAGGATTLGAGGNSLVLNNSPLPAATGGNPGLGYGGGGGGGRGTSAAGGTGATGVVIIEEFY
jgi:hypothetical protein